MQFLSLAPFVPSGPDFCSARELFQALGFPLNWEAGDYAGFGNEGCRFILQNFNNREFAENFMVTVRVPDVDAFYNQVAQNQLVKKFGIRINQPTQQHYGKEVNLIDLAGVCWHFVEE